VQLIKVNRQCRNYNYNNADVDIVIEVIAHAVSATSLHSSETDWVRVMTTNTFCQFVHALALKLFIHFLICLMTYNLFLSWHMG